MLTGRFLIAQLDNLYQGKEFIVWRGLFQQVSPSEFCESRTSKRTPDQGWPRRMRRRQLIDFAKTDDVDPLLFYKPYYLDVSQALDKGLYALARSLAENLQDLRRVEVQPAL